MRYFYSFILLVLFCGCYTAKKADKQLDKAFRKQPVATAKKVQMWYPISSDSHEVVKWRLQIDTLYQDLVRDSIITDTFTNEKVKVIFKKVAVIREKILKQPAIYRIDSAKIFLMQDKINKAEKEKEKYQKKFKIFFYISIAFVVLFLLLWVYYLLKRK